MRVAMFGIMGLVGAVIASSIIRDIMVNLVNSLRIG